MDFELSDEQKALREQIVRFAQQELNTGVSERDRDQAFPHDLWLKCGELGLQGLPIDTAHGGSGLDPLTTAIALESLGYGCHDSGLVFSICAHLLACVVPIGKYGTEEQKARYLPSLCNGQLIAVNAMSEPQAGSDAFAIRTTAEVDGDDYRINGVKTWSSNGPVADIALVFAVTDKGKGYMGGVSAFLVEKATHGFDVGQKFEKMGLRSNPISELIFDDVRVPRSAMLGQPGAGSGIFTHSMDWERVCLFASHVGTMQRLLEETISYARTRKQFDQIIGKFQAVSHPIVDMQIRLEAARLLVYKAASQLEKTRSVSKDAAMAKIFTSEAYKDMAMRAVQIYGGNGYMVEYQMERMLRDAVGSTIYSGTSEMQRNIVASWLGL